MIRVDQHIPHLLALGRAFFQDKMVLLSAFWGMGDAHI